jgi:hypothetical protein
MSGPLPLLLEALEDRLTPTTFGFPWLDGRHLTVSFVPDGTPVGPGTTSNLFGALNNAVSPQSAVWQREILRGLQDWAAQANLDVSVVADSGAPLGTPGLIQGDPRFGDVRIGMAPLSAGSVSTAVPLNFDAGTWSGDILLNSNYAFTVGASATAYDLSSITLHEAGHVLGLEGNLNATSAMFEYYNGVRSGPTSADVAAMQDLYGPRTPDSHENNDTPAQATGFVHGSIDDYVTRARDLADPASLTPLTVDGDITTNADVDYFRYRARGTPAAFTLSLRTSGVSLLTARLTVRDQSGNVVATTASTDPLNGDLSVRVAGAVAGQRYTFEVESNRADAFGVGAYRLRLQPDDPAVTACVLARALARLGEEDAGDEELAATPLTPVPGAPAGHAEFAGDGSLATTTEVDYYSLTAPHLGKGEVQSLTVTLRASDPFALPPQVTVYDARGTVVTGTVLANANGEFVLRVDGVKSSAKLYLAVQAAGGQTGPYHLTAQFGVPASGLTTVLSGTVSGADADPSNQQFRAVQLPQTELVTFRISASAPGVTVESALLVNIHDAQGNILWQGTVLAGHTLSVTLLLPAGGLEFSFVGGTADGSDLTGLNYTVQAEVLSDPVGPPLVDPDNPPPRDLTPIWVEDGIYFISALFDPYGRPILRLF